MSQEGCAKKPPGGSRAAKRGQIASCVASGGMSSPATMASASTGSARAPTGSPLAPRPLGATSSPRRTSDALMGTSASADLSAAASNAGGRSGDGGVENVMDELLLKYLRDRGYEVTRKGQNTSQGGGRDAGASPSAVTRAETVGMAAGSVGRPSTGEDRRKFLGAEDGRIEDATLGQYAKQLGLSTEACTANHLLFYGLTGGDPRAYDEAYGKLLEWICNSLDMYRYELHAVAFPLFVHCFLELLAKGYAEAAKAFFHRYASDHARLHLEELRTLSLVSTPAHLRENEYVREVLHSKFTVEMSLLSFELLNTFLSQERLFLLLAMVNERVNLVVTSNQPGLQLQQLQDDAAAAEAAVLNNLEPKQDAASGYKTSDELAQVVAASDCPNESEIAATLTTGDYNVDYMVRSAGGSSTTGAGANEARTLGDLHAIKVHWGVLPERKVPVTDDASGTDAAKTKDSDMSASNGIAKGSAAAGDAGKGATDKKNALGAGGSTAASSAAKDAGAASGKASDTTGGKTSGDKTASTTEAQRKHKRVKLLADATVGKKKELLESTGPLPDRKDAFNAELLEKLVLRMPAEMKTHTLEDLRVRTSVSRSALPSALCFTLLNSAAHINNLCFSDDVTMVGAACDDSSFRVWRNDDQPLGTATGSVYHGSVGTADAEAEEDEKTAVLRGHSSAVYGASFSPDDRFALTASGDSTVRLWSLAAKSNLAIYRSHMGAPVWDVSFAPLGYYFASCSMDRTARLWSTDHLTPLRIFAGHLSDVDCVRFHPNHNYLATGSSDKTVRLWDVQSGKCLRVFTGHFHGVQCLAFSRNGRYLASSGEDQYINIWDLQAGKRLETLVGHKAAVTSLDFSQESSVLASGGMDSTVRLWDMKALAEKPTTHSSGLSGALAAMQVNSSPSTPASTAAGSMASQGVPGRSRFVKPVPIVRPGAVQELPSSRFLLKTLRSKQTPIYRVHFTSRNLLLAGGVFQPKMES